MTLTETIALYLGAAWASGLNLYATVLVLGYLEHSGQVHLPATLAIAAHPVVMLVAGALYAIEFFADKIPWVDSIWDAVHTFIRIPAGALLAIGALQPMDPVVETIALLLAGTIAAGSHGVKMSTRLALNLSPEPFTNWMDRVHLRGHSGRGRTGVDGISTDSVLLSACRACGGGRLFPAQAFSGIQERCCICASEVHARITERLARHPPACVSA